ncbi:acl-3, partial [Pristionchus pacificus]
SNFSIFNFLKQFFAMSIVIELICLYPNNYLSESLTMTGSLQDKSLKGGFKFPWPFPSGKPSAFYRFKSYLAMSFVGILSKSMFVGGVNKMVVKNKDTFMKVLKDRSRPLITVANHRCNIDDPLMFALMTRREFADTLDHQRYTLTAHNICFTKQSHTTLFSLGRCVPCVRGEGVNQKGMDFCLEKMEQDNAWIHIFSEGKVVEEPGRFKWGVGRLVNECSKPPLILPIWIEGMNKVWPNHPPYYPRFGNTVNVFIGDVIDTKDWLKQLKNEDKESGRKKMTDLIQRSLYTLGEKSGCLPIGSADLVESNDHSRKKYYK